jgi:hypothetical protein
LYLPETGTLPGFVEIGGRVMGRFGKAPLITERSISSKDQRVGLFSFVLVLRCLNFKSRRGRQQSRDLSNVLRKGFANGFAFLVLQHLLLF